MIVGEVQPGSPAARADLRVGDRVAHANGQAIEGRMDWQRVRVNLDPATPLELRVERAGPGHDAAAAAHLRAVRVAAGVCVRG